MPRRKPVPGLPFWIAAHRDGKKCLRWTWTLDDPPTQHVREVCLIQTATMYDVVAPWCRNGLAKRTHWMRVLVQVPPGGFQPDGLRVIGGRAIEAEEVPDPNAPERRS